MSFTAARGIEVFLDTQAAEVARVQEHAAKVTRSASLARSPGLEPEVAEMMIDAVAFRVQALYTGIEAVLKDVAGEIDGFQPSGESWHARLADQLATAAGGRPALLTETTARMLRELRGFRHRLRHDSRWRSRPNALPNWQRSPPRPAHPSLPIGPSSLYGRGQRRKSRQSETPRRRSALPDPRLRTRA